MRVWGVVVALILASAVQAQTITDARYTDPTTTYPHGVLGDEIEHKGLEVTLSNGASSKIIWRKDVVFEDTAPRLVDMDGDGAPEVMVVESHFTQGGRLSFYKLDGGTLEHAASIPWIGRRFRWLAPIGAADLDGDGFNEFAYIDRPHLAKTLRVWRYVPMDNGVTLRHVADLAGLTNHRIGEPDIAGGLRDCGTGPEMITASADWTQIMATRLDNGTLTSRPIARHKNRNSFVSALNCP